MCRATHRARRTASSTGWWRARAMRCTRSPTPRSPAATCPTCLWKDANQIYPGFDDVSNFALVGALKDADQTCPGKDESSQREQPAGSSRNELKREVANLQLQQRPGRQSSQRPTEPLVRVRFQ
mmetsp:Transcript_16287/g.51188  ORF Transcript_16287/g.51188 Transcript_16287/m.51188 type:complete len:124 (-) Transcript_16287:160-531(-)